MSAEKILSTEQKKFTARVDINDLLARIRKENTKKNKINLVFFGLFSVLILIVGLLLSL